MNPPNDRTAKSPPRLASVISEALFNRKNHPTLGIPKGLENRIISVLLGQYLDIVAALPEEKRLALHSAFVQEHLRISDFPNTRETLNRADVLLIENKIERTVR